MKTIEEKAKAYDELTAKLKEWHNGLQDGSPAKETLEYLLPQFRESEDEKIRKEIIDYFESRLSTAEEAEILYFKCWIAYLEKQKKIIDSITASRITIRPDGGIERPTIGYLEKQKEQKPDDLSLDKLVEFFEKTAKQYDIDLPHRGYDIYHLCKDLYNFIYTFLPIPEQKPTWSEEEMKVLNSIIDDYEKAAKSFCGYDGKIGLLKAIRDGEYDLPKQEWSEEDEKNMATMIEILNLYQRFYDGGIITSIDDRGGFLKRMIELSNWLKSLRPSWKPSEEQMRGLKYFLDYHRPQRNAGTTAWKEFDSVDSLYNDLLKLK